MPSILPLFRSSSRRFGSFEPVFLLFLASNTSLSISTLTQLLHPSQHPLPHPSPHPSHIAPLLQSLHRARRDRAELHLRLWLIAQRAAIKHSLQIGTSGHLDLLERHEVSIFQLQGPQRRVVPKQKTLRLLKRPHAQLDILQIRTV